MGSRRDRSFGAVRNSLARCVWACVAVILTGYMVAPAHAQDDKGGACITVVHSFPQLAFEPNQEGFQIKVTLNSSCDEVYALGFRADLPEGWVFTGIQGTGQDIPQWNTESPAAGGIVEFAWIDVPAFPVEFTYTVNVGNTQSSQTLTGNALYRVLDGPQENANGQILAQLSQPPEIVLLGDSLVTLNCGEEFIEPGYLASDSVEGDITDSVRVVDLSGFDNRKAGDYVFEYIATNSFNKSATARRTIRVTDQEPPTTTLTGATVVELECGNPFNDPGATAIDLCEGDVSTTRTGALDVNVPGTYILNYSATDSGGNRSNSVVRTIIVSDSRPPAISLIGSATVTLECGNPYVDLGATATDFCEGDLTSEIVRNQSNVNATKVGTYTVTYSVSDSSGNAAAQVTRSVVVSDTIKPVITLNGPSAITLQCGSSYTELGASAVDACRGSLVVEIDPSALKLNVPGVYAVKYRARDTVTATSVKDRTITVIDTEAPKLELIGDEVMVVECGATFTDPGTTVTDNCDKDLTATAVGTVDTSKPGSYRINYSVSDPNQNTDTASRLVVVEDSTAPTITLLGNAAVVLECSTPFIDPGATATDGCGGELTGLITVGGDRVNISEPGEYVISYSVKDPAGNSSETLTRTVRVADTIAPALTLNGGDDAIDCGGVFLDLGASSIDQCDGDLTSSIVVTGDDFDTNVPGVYSVVYSSEDASGRKSTATRTVTVRDFGCAVEGEGEGGQVEGEGEGSAELPVCAPESVSILEPVSNLIVPRGTSLTTVALRSSITYSSETECELPESITVLYAIDGVLVGSSKDQANAFPVSVPLGRGDYVLSATAVPADRGAAVSEVKSFSIIEAVDNDANGILDNPFLNMPGNGDLWQANVATEDCGERAVLLRSWRAEGSGDITASLVNPANPSQSIIVTVKRGLLVEGEQGILIVSMACSLESLFDPFSVSKLVDTLPAGPISGQSFVDISVIVSSDNGATYTQLETVEVDGAPAVEVRYESSSLVRGATFRSYPTLVDGGTVGLEVMPDDGAWTRLGVENVVSTTGRLLAKLRHLSTLGLFVAVDLPAEISSDTQALNFGSLKQGNTRDLAVTVQNLGDATLTGTASVDGAGFSLVDGASFNLDSGDTQTVTVRFAPNAAQSFSGSLLLSGGEGGDITVSLTGNGTLFDKGASATGCGTTQESGSLVADLLVVGFVLSLLLIAGWKRRTA
jgi:hypothetical protein